GVEVVFKPHPYTGSRKADTRKYLALMKRFCNANGIVVEESLSSIHQCMNKSDVLICDVSSVLNDYLITRKRIILCVNERMMGMDIDQDFPSARAAYKASSANDVGDTLQLLQSEDPLAQYRAEVRRDSLGDFPEGSLARFSQVIRESVASAVQKKLTVAAVPEPQPFPGLEVRTGRTGMAGHPGVHPVRYSGGADAPRVRRS